MNIKRQGSVGTILEADYHTQRAFFLLDCNWFRRGSREQTFYQEEFSHTVPEPEQIDPMVSKGNFMSHLLRELSSSIQDGETFPIY